MALGSPRRETVEAVAQALSRYSDNGEVLTRLIAQVQRGVANPVLRREVVRVLGAFVDKRSANALMHLLQDPNESASLKADAADALMAMTATPPSTSPDWNLWWQLHQNQSDGEFRAGLLALRSGTLDWLRLHDAERSSEIVNLLREQYTAFKPDERANVLVRYLKSADPTVRTLGTTIATEEGRLGQAVATAVRDQLRSMISDSDADVRIGAATALAKINDPDALGQLQAQLTQEPDPEVKAALARALGVIDDAKAVPQLLGLLDDSNPRVVQAAALALNEQLAAQIQRDKPELASQAADALRKAFEKLTPPTPANEDTRQALLAPMVSLKQEKLLPLLNPLLAQQRDMSPGIKRLALNAIGNIGSPLSAGAILSQLGDPDDSVRRAAVNALGTNPEAKDHAWELMSRVDPQTESNAAVRSDAWNAVSSLLPQLPVTQLQQFASKLANQPDQRLLVLKAEAAQLQDQKNLVELANVQENIGTALSDQGSYSDAAVYFGTALNSKRQQSAPPAASAEIDLLVGERMDALLRAKQYKEAIAFANEVDVDSRNLQLIGVKINQEVQRLRQPAQLDLDAAKQLITQTSSLKPPLADNMKEDLANIDRDINQKLGAKGAGPSGYIVPENANAPIAGSKHGPAITRSVYKTDDRFTSLNG